MHEGLKAPDKHRKWTENQIRDVLSKKKYFEIKLGFEKYQFFYVAQD